MTKKVSVIVPVYNVEKYLDRCMESIVRQTYQNMEIILVDDGSEDNSGTMCDIWSEKDCRISVIHQENGGLSNARNSGIKKSTGEYLTFIDSDDVVAPNMLEHLIELLDGEQADVSICDVNHIFDKNRIFFDVKSSKKKVFDGCTAIKEMWYQKSFLPSVCGKVYKRSVFSNIRFTEGIFFEDIDVLHEILWRCNKVIYQDIKLYGYIHRENSITTKRFSIRDCVILQISKKLLQFATKNEKRLIPAAQSYAVTAAFRVYLNAPPNSVEFNEQIMNSERIIKRYGKAVLKDKEARCKTKYALILYFYCKPLLMIIYRHKNRWI